MRRLWVGVVLAAISCTGDREATVAVGSSTTSDTSSGGLVVLGESSNDDSPTAPFPDLPAVDRSCEDRGTVFSPVSEPVEVENFNPTSTIFDIGLAAGPMGMLVTFTNLDQEADQFTYRGVQLKMNGVATGPSWAISQAKGRPAAFARDGAILVTNCASDVVSWRAYDERGAAIGPVVAASSLPSCAGPPPAGAWTNSGYTAAWATLPSSTCPQGCLVAALATNNVFFGTTVLQPSVFVTDPLSIAVAEESVLIVASHVNAFSQNELALSLMDHSGGRLFPPMVYPFDSAEPGLPQVQAPIAAAATADEGFVVFIGGRGSAYGRVRFDAVASTVAELEDVPIGSSEGFAGDDIFRSSLRVSRRTGGYVLYGPASEGTASEGMLLVMADRNGDATSQTFLPGVVGVAVVTREGRTWVAYSKSSPATLETMELGCRFNG